MSSLQKFHRRTFVAAGGGAFSFTTIGSGDADHGFWLGDGMFNALIAAPKSSEVQREWGSSGTTRGTTSTTNGALNTGTLYGFGSAAHPAAYYCKSLTTGGYNTWYLPAKDELTTLYSNHTATPFATANAFGGNYSWSSTESNSTTAWACDLNNGSEAVAGKGNAVGRYVRPTRRVSLATTVGQGDATVGYWLGTAGDGVSKLIVAPKSTEIKLAWGSYGITRGVFNTSYGLPNTNTLYGYGNSTAAGHPAAYYCKTLTTGGYNTWYMPADNELLTMYSNHAATPFSVSNGFNTSGDVWSSTEKDNYAGKYRNLMSGADGSNGSKKVLITVRAIRGL